MINRIRQAAIASEDENYRRDPFASFGAAAGKFAAGYLLNRALLYVPTGIDRRHLRYLWHYRVPPGIPVTHYPGLYATHSASVREVIWNAIKATEETLFKMPRAFSASALYGSGIYSRGKFVVPEFFENYGNVQYLNRIGADLSNIDFKRGVRFERGILYGFDVFGNEHVILESARAYPAYWGKTLGLQGFTPKAIRALYSKYNIPIGQQDVIFTRGGLRGVREIFEAIATVAAENYVKLLDNPFALWLELTGKSIENASPAVRRLAEKFFLKDQFGVGGKTFLRGDYRNILRTHFLRGLPKIAAGIIGYKALSHLVQLATGYTIGGHFANIYQGTTLAYTNISDITGLTAYSKAQEKAAPGSTSLAGLLAFPLSFGIFGATTGKIIDIMERESIQHGGEAPIFFRRIASKLEEAPNVIGRIASRMHLSSYRRVGAFGLMGALAGGLAVLPFLPGVIGSKRDTEELERIYSGEQLVEKRRGAFWEFGISPWEGDDIEYFAPHWTVKLKTDAATKGRLPEEYYNNRFALWLERLFNPYALEEALDEERPYTFWGPSDWGLGLAEKLLLPVKYALKPLALAHPEGLEGIHPRLRPQLRPEMPEELKSQYIDERGYVIRPQLPTSLQSMLAENMYSAMDLAGVQGFLFQTLYSKLSGEQSALTPLAEYETSGRILSMQRRYWDLDIGGGLGTTEAYRRLNPDRPYETQYIPSPLRNKMPSWMPEEFQYGDPYTLIPEGELRLPGRGYAALHPELEGIEPEEYPAAYRMAILNDVAPYSTGFYKYKYLTEQQIQQGKISESQLRIYQEALRQREMMMNDEQFNYGEGPVGSYYLTLKKIGRALPTEALYPFAPIHKFAGPVDPLTEYYSRELLDKQFKLWQNPIKDFIIPAINRTVNLLNLGDTSFIPPDVAKRYEIESYFNAMEYQKNENLRRLAAEYAKAGFYEAASYIRSGIRDTLYEHSPYEDIDTLKNLLPRRQRRYLESMLRLDEASFQKAVEVTPPELSTILQAQRSKLAMMEEGDIQTISQLRQNVKMGPPIAEIQNIMPGNDFIGWAPGVDLNAMKVKILNNLGENIHDYGLWRSDEQKAILLDELRNGKLESFSPIEEFSSGIQKQRVQDMLNKLGVPTMSITALPTSGASSITITGIPDRKRQIQRKMDEYRYQYWQ